MNKFRKSLLVTALMAAGMSSTYAAPIVPTTSNSFVMLDPAGFLTGFTPSVTFTWDGTYNTNVGTAVDNATLVSGPTAFFGYTWTAHNVRVFSGPATYVFPYPANTTAPVPWAAGTQTVTIGAGQVAISMLFDWGTNLNIPVVEVCEPGVSAAAAFPDATVWDCASVDSNGDGIPGIPMAAGPFAGFNANFNLMGLVAPGGVAGGGPVLAVVRPAATSSGASGGGGCAMDPAGRDASLLLALLGGLGYTSWRRRRS